ncbi:MAG: hypothetical protein AAF318_19430 [Pseudomonadota bacterium]
MNDRLEPTRARQGERGRSMLTVLTISTAAAAVLAAAGFIYVSTQDDTDLNTPVGQTDTAT